MEMIIRKKRQHINAEATAKTILRSFTVVQVTVPPEGDPSSR
jgi:hypothetical protein